MSATPLYQGQTFYSPRFEIRLKGQNLGREVIRDVLSVSYREDLQKLDSFEFTLHDWDPVERLPKYSSPFDATGQLRRIGEYDVPNFEPGAEVELHLGYGDTALTRLMVGRIVALAPSFPASGTPTLTVRAVNRLSQLQRQQASEVFESMTDTAIAQSIASDLDIPLRTAQGQESQEQQHDYVMMRNEYPILFLLGRARRLGYDLYMERGEDEEPYLWFGPRAGTGTTYQLTWGRSLIKFMPTLTLRNQVAKVVVKGWNPLASGDDRSVTGEATLQDLDRELPDPQLLASIDSALAQTHEVVVDDPIRTREEANARALGILQTLANDLITAQGSTVGFPGLRAGGRLQIDGVGPRFSGNYIITDVTHALSASGYTTDFSARLEGPSRG